jgi:site-specific DNA-cytosine methylase
VSSMCLNAGGQRRLDAESETLIPTIGGGFDGPVAFHPTQDPISSSDGSTHAMGCGSKDGAATVAVAYDDRNQAYSSETHHTLRAEGVGSRVSDAVISAMQVRRLTPVECERLQGFPDGYTAIPWRNKPASECPDGPRYKALGNSWAVPVVRWIGRRIAAATSSHPSSSQTCAGPRSPASR